MDEYPVAGGCVLDIEVAPDICLVGLRNHRGQYRQWECSIDWCDDPDDLRTWLDGKLLVTFNGLHFDYPLLCEIVNEGLNDPVEIYGSASILLGDDREAQFKYRKQHQGIEGVDHIDIMPLSGFKISGGLKALGLRLERQTVETFEFTPGKNIGSEQFERLRQYNIADLELTWALYEQHQGILEARRILSVQYGADLRSKSDSQLGEYIVLREYESLTGISARETRQSCLGSSTVPKYSPSWLESVTDPIVRGWYESLPDFIDTASSAKVLESRLFVGDRYFKTGAGGLHSVDDAGAWVTDQGDGPMLILDLDVASFYPSLMLQEGIAPRHMDEDAALQTLSDLTERRLTKKRESATHEAAALKIAVNALYGKTRSQYSALYDPYVQLAVSVSGQLALLQLIVIAGEAGATVLSANTDGVVLTVPYSKSSCVDQVKQSWESLTGLTLERTNYRGFYQLSGNDYVALCTDGSIKTKGQLRNYNDLRHNPVPWVIAEAVIRQIADGQPVEYTVKRLAGEGDIRPFLFSSTLRLKQGEYTTQGGNRYSGVLRWYRSNNSDDLVRIKLDGSEARVPNGTSARVVMSLPEGIPDDLDVGYYIIEAKDKLRQVRRRKRIGRNSKVQRYVEQGLTPCPTWQGTKNLKGSSKSALPAWGTVDYSPYTGFAVGTGEKYGILCIDIDHPDLLDRAVQNIPGLWDMLFGTPTTMVQAVPVTFPFMDPSTIRGRQSRGKLLFKMAGSFKPASNQHISQLFGFELFYKESVAFLGGPREDGKVYVTNEVPPADIPADLESWLREHCVARPKIRGKGKQRDLLKLDIAVQLPAFAEDHVALSDMAFEPDKMDGKGALIGPCPGHHRRPGDRDLMVGVGDDGGLILKCLHTTCDFTDEQGAQLRDAWQGVVSGHA